MEILFVLIPLSVLLIAFALWSFVWSVKNDQFEDLDRQGWTILFDDKDGDDKGGDKGDKKSSGQEGDNNLAPASDREDKQP